MQELLILKLEWMKMKKQPLPKIQELHHLKPTLAKMKKQPRQKTPELLPLAEAVVHKATNVFCALMTRINPPVLQILFQHLRG